MTTGRLYCFAALLSALALAGCGRSDNTGAQTTSVATGVDFLMFPNPHPSLGVGDYDVIITNTSGSAFTYILTIVSTDGGSKTASGSLNNGANTTVSFEQRLPGGVTITLSNGGASATLALRVSGTSSNISSASGANPGIELPRYQTDAVAYAQAYYAAIDPGNDRDTLTKFKTTNGFGPGACTPTGAQANPLVLPVEFNVRFRDVLDLGYGRHMCMRQNANGDIAVWVENFQVTAIPGIKYGPLNLEAVVNDDRRWHVGTNAIEFSPGPGGGARFTKFYTYNPDGTRRLQVDLDGRGAKALPVPCISCHGGHALPLTADGLFPAIRTSARGDTLARMQPLNVGTLDFAPSYPYRRMDQEASLKAMNQIVLCAYPLTGASAGDEDDCRTANANLEWSGTDAASMIKSWYGGNGLPNATHSDTFVPTSWTDAGSGVAGSQNLYQSVVASNCRVCHLLRGNRNESGIDFVTYNKFAGTNPSTGYNDRIKHHVFDKGNMPLALLKFETFWESSAPTTLASFITGAMSGNTVLQPTRPVAKPGPNRTVRTGVAAKLSAAESVNAISYRWRVTSGNANNATLTDENSIRPTFTANVDGTYEVELVVSDGTRASDPATLTIFANSTIADPASIRFSDIRDILQGAVAPATGCAAGGCHTDPTANPGGPPVYYLDYDRDGSGGAPDAADLTSPTSSPVAFFSVQAATTIRAAYGTASTSTTRSAVIELTTTPSSTGF
jgi:hypothetical protein